jgi:hypothetical protein
LSDSFTRLLGIDADRTRAIIAHTLYFMGETVKWEVAVTPEPRHDFAKPHGLMRAAMAGNQHRVALDMRYDGRAASCTIESLYFRMLLLARFASGALNCKQIEILDAWMWLWMPALSGVTTPPAGNALRADLDTRDALRHGPRQGEGLSLYLPQDPIEKAYRSLLAEFQAGRIVPAVGIASTFRIEEHVAVLDLVRRGLRYSRGGPTSRAERHPRDHAVEMMVGLTEITSRAFASPQPAAPTIALSIVGAPERKPAQRREAALDDIYEARRRMVRLANVSDTGLGLECPLSASESIATGDLVAVSIAEGEPPVVGKVVRSAPSKRPGRVILGVRRLASGLDLVDLSREQPGCSPEQLQLTYVAGRDASGRHDAFLVSERAYAERGTYTARIDKTLFTFRFNRVRQRGRGWVLAGFEVVSARAASQVA